MEELEMIRIEVKVVQNYVNDVKNENNMKIKPVMLSSYITQFTKIKSMLANISMFYTKWGFITNCRF